MVFIDGQNRPERFRDVDIDISFSSTCHRHTHHAPYLGNTFALNYALYPGRRKGFRAVGGLNWRNIPLDWHFVFVICLNDHHSSFLVRLPCVGIAREVI